MRIFASLIILLQCYLQFGASFRPLSTTSRLGTRLQLQAKSDLIVGLNKYSHDAAVCIIDGDNGEIVFAQAKERISGKKHDGGSCASIVEYGLRSIGASIEDVIIVVSNNHHYRVLPFERRLPFSNAINYTPNDYMSVNNLLPNAKHYELSHHLAHAWSAIGTAPFRSGLVLVMDGMGEQYGAMAEDMADIEENSGDYMHDLKLLRAFGGEGFMGQPTSLFPGSSYREGETAYIFDSTSIKPIFKRWCRERSPSELYNHGFENMESLGSVYSRISSQVLGDWNACGKIMGLGPWSDKKKQDAQSWGYSDVNSLGLGQDFHHKVRTMSGNPYDGSFRVDWGALEGLGQASTWKGGTAAGSVEGDTKFGEYANLAKSVQADLESCALSLISSLKAATAEDNLAIVGGVGLNSVLNGRVLRESGFKNVFVPPGPGDEGVAVGCALYGLQRSREERAFDEAQGGDHRSSAEDTDGSDYKGLTAGSDRALSKAMAMFGNADLEYPTATKPAPSAVTEVSDGPVKQRPVELPNIKFSPYSGREFTDKQIANAIEELAPWVDAEYALGGGVNSTLDSFLEDAAQRIASGQVLAWFQGKSEFGQRALGSRSILADPRSTTARSSINDKVKEREWWRPLAPSVLDEHAGDWFDGLTNGGNASPYMSLTATLRPGTSVKVPAVAHIDDSARLQTVNEHQCPLYHQLITKLHGKTGVPMVLNTSFNKKGQPIVETPVDAIRTFLSCQGNIDALFIGGWVVTRKAYPLAKAGSVGEVPVELTVLAEPYYLSETTAASQGGCPKIRIDVGGDVGGDSQEPQWLDLPSQLHYDILQVLQPVPHVGADSSDYSLQSPEKAALSSDDIAVGELYEAVSWREDEDGEAAVTWKAFKTCVQWLHDRSLVSFQMHSGNLTSEAEDVDQVSDSQGGGLIGAAKSGGDDDIAQLFKGTTVVDLRGLDDLM